MTRLVYSLWKGLARGEHRRFLRGLRNLPLTQHGVLQPIVSKNKSTVFGKVHDFQKIQSVDDFRSCVPLSSYEDYESYIDRIRLGEPNVLTAERVLRLSPTSGSSGPIKLIPITATLMQEFRRGLQPWLYDIFSRIPDLANGPAFWSISPHVDLRVESEVPVGFDADSSYLSGLVSRLMQSTLSVPEDASRVKDFDLFRNITLLHLLRQEGTRILSAWNPSYMLHLLDCYDRQKEAIIRQIYDGKLLEEWKAPGISRSLSRFVPNRSRARSLETLTAESLYKAWPHLGLISAWQDGPAADPAVALQARFPRVLFQPKGLLTTEAFVSFPWMDRSADGHLVSVRSHFFEFAPVDEAGNLIEDNTYLVHEIRDDRLYTVFVTTGGGFYRYRIYDIVRVTGRWNGLPLLRFLGKCDLISDVCGEKLSQGFAQESLNRFFDEAPAARPCFAMLAPEHSCEGMCYTLFLEIDRTLSQESLLLLDGLLRRNYHYDLARKAEQLRALSVCYVRDGSAKFLTECIRRGKKAGDVKPTPLHPDLHWRSVFLSEA